MIYFDNAATTFPKPLSVRSAVNTAITHYGGNPGRSGHKLSMITANEIYKSRQLVADLFETEPENVIFTFNCTHSLNLAIQGIISENDHIIISSLEHNSVSRPVHALSAINATYSIADVNDDDDKTIKNFERLITPQTKAIVCTIASNVTGQILPFKQIAKLCQKHNLCFIADGAQACGVIPVKMSDGINILCCPGHKGLYGTTGTGVLITDGKYQIKALMQGGTGSTSDELEQTPFLPEKLESGTLNTVGVISLGAGIKFINKMKMSKIHRYENMLCDIFINGIKDLKGIYIYRNQNANYLPIVSFSFKNMSSNELSSKLSDEGFALRGGLHCAYVTHNYLHSIENGTVRFAPSVFNNKSQVNHLVNVIKKISKSL